MACECGCGRWSGVWTGTDRTLGRVKGQPKRFIQGHSGPPRLSWPDDETLIAMAARLQSRVAMARELGVSHSALWKYLHRRPDLESRLDLYRHDPKGKPTRKRERLRRWRTTNQEGSRQLRRKHEASRRARKLGAWVEAVDPRIVFAMHGGRCGICGEFIVGPFHVDHTTPLAAGGLHGYVNVQPAHPDCNLRKGATCPPL